jgi:hypothetical protein
LRGTITGLVVGVNLFGVVCQLDITCPSPLVLAVLNGDWAVTVVFKLPEQSPTLLLRQLPQIYEYTHISCLLYAYCTPVTATVIVSSYPLFCDVNIASVSSNPPNLQLFA